MQRLNKKGLEVLQASKPSELGMTVDRNKTSHAERQGESMGKQTTQEAIVRKPLDKKKVQAMIPKTLWLDAEKKLDAEGLKWVELLTDLINGWVNGKIK